MITGNCYKYGVNLASDTRPNKWPSIPVVGLFAFLLLFSMSCQKSTLTQETETETLEIGILAPLTGAAASIGESTRLAIDIAFQDVNEYLESTGSSVRADFQLHDTQTDPTTALQELKNLKDQGIRMVIGPFSSTNCAAVVDYANRNGILLLSPASVATSLAVGNDNLFRMAPSDGNQAEAITALFDHDNITTVIPIIRNDVWGEGLFENVSELLAQQGKTIANPIHYNPANVNSSDIADQVATTIAQAVHHTPAANIGVYLLSFGEGTDILEAASQEANCALVRWYGSSAFANNASLPANADAAKFAAQQSFRAPAFANDPAGMDLLEPVYQQLSVQLRRSPEIYALTTYDAVWLMALAFRDNQDPNDLASFRTTLEQEGKYHYGITGRTTFDEAGDRKHASFAFWGISDSGGFEWENNGHYFNSTGQLELE